MQRAALLSEYLYEFASGMHRATRQKATRARHSFTFLPPSLSLSLFFSFSFSRVLSLPARFLLGRISSAFIILCVSNSNFLFPPLFRSRSSLARPRAIHYSYQRRDRGSRVRSASDFGTAPVGSRARARARGITSPRGNPAAASRAPRLRRSVRIFRHSRHLERRDAVSRHRRAAAYNNARIIFACSRRRNGDTPYNYNVLTGRRFISTKCRTLWRVRTVLYKIASLLLRFMRVIKIQLIRALIRERRFIYLLSAAYYPVP